MKKSNSVFKHCKKKKKKGRGVVIGVYRSQHNHSVQKFEVNVEEITGEQYTAKATDKRLLLGMAFQLFAKVVGLLWTGSEKAAPSPR